MATGLKGKQRDQKGHHYLPDIPQGQNGRLPAESGLVGSLAILARGLAAETEIPAKLLSGANWRWLFYTDPFKGVGGGKQKSQMVKEYSGSNNHNSAYKLISPHQATNVSPAEAC